jgi:hypothetical protein
MIGRYVSKVTIDNTIYNIGNYPSDDQTTAMRHSLLGHCSNRMSSAITDITSKTESSAPA